MRTLLVAESRVFRTAFSEALVKYALIELVASEFSAARGLQRLARGDIDLVLLDLALAGGPRDGFMKRLGDVEGQSPLVIAISPEDAGPECAEFTLSYRGFAGAVQRSGGDMTSIVKALGSTISRLLMKKRTPPRAIPETDSSASGLPPSEEPSELGKLVVIVSSTGGPAALQALLSGLSPAFRTPIVIVQHLPPGFHNSLATNLGRQTGRAVRVARDRELISGRQILLAPGGSHLEVERVDGSLVSRVVEGPRENGCKPAGDRTLRSAARASAGSMVGVCLTGMGRDGADGMAEVARSGGQVIVQDETTSVVWGMPSSVLATGTRAIVLPIGGISAALNRKGNRAA